MSASAGEAVAQGQASDTSGGVPPGEGRAVTGFALTEGATRAARPKRSRSRQAAGRRLPTEGPRPDNSRRRPSRRDKSAPSSGPFSSTKSQHSPSVSATDPSGTDSTGRSRGLTASVDSGCDHVAIRCRRRARGSDKLPQRTLVQGALCAFQREQWEETVENPRFKGLLSPKRYRIAQRGGRRHLPRGTSLSGIRADV